MGGPCGRGLVWFPLDWDWQRRNTLRVAGLAGRSCWILFTFKNGARFGGYFGRNSFASSYPEAPDLFVEDLWRVDEYGRFGDRVEGNLGMFVRYEECDQMQLFAAEE